MLWLNMGQDGQHIRRSCFSPVDAESTKAEHRDAHRSLLDEGDQLAHLHAEGPVLGQELEKNHRVNRESTSGFP